MRLQILSDLHYDYYNRDGYIDSDTEATTLDLATLKTDADILIMAGDLVTKIRRMHDVDKYKLLIDFMLSYKHVLYVPGNHDYWSSKFNPTHEFLASVNNIWFHYLNNSVIEIEGQRFVGSPLWFEDYPMAWTVARNFSDFCHINEPTETIFSKGTECFEFLKKEVEPDDVVITHHLPTNLSTPQRFKYDEYNCFYVHYKCAVILENMGPKVWIHGHTHDFCDYRVCDTRIICNPYGYPDERTNYENVIIEI